jgi:hypothetical protein
LIKILIFENLILNFLIKRRKRRRRRRTWWPIHPQRWTATPSLKEKKKREGGPSTHKGWLGLVVAEPPPWPRGGFGHPVKEKKKGEPASSRA